MLSKKPVQFKTLVLDIAFCFFDSFILFFSRFISKPEAEKRKKVVFVRMDAIGDFVLWMSTFEDLQKIYPKPKYDWVLIGSNASQALATTSGFFNEIITFDGRAFSQSLIYRIKTAISLGRIFSDIVIHPTFSRDFRVSDSIVRFLRSPIKIGFDGDRANISSFAKKLSNLWYSELCPSNPNNQHELYRHAEFISYLSKKPLVYKIPSLRTESPEKNIINEPYFVLFPGASWSGRQWQLRHFFSVAQKIKEDTGWSCVLCGASQDLKVFEREFQALDSIGQSTKFLNLMGQTSLDQLIHVLNKAELLITNETSAVHIGAAVGTPTVCILGGGHFGRFTPWVDENGKHLSNPVCVFTKMDCFGCNWNCIFERNEQEPVKCINDLSVDRVYEAAKMAIKRNV
jgi:ADP-heptose:LPS heptosyltransferase